MQTMGPQPPTGQQVAQLAAKRIQALDRLAKEQETKIRDLQTRFSTEAEKYAAIIIKQQQTIQGLNIKLSVVV